MRFVKTLLASVIACLLVCSAAYAQDRPTLFKNFVYGMSRADVQKICNAVPSDEPGAEDLLIAQEPIKFANIDWIEAFRFNRSDQLTQVLLLQEHFSMDAYIALIKGLVSNGYMIANMSDGSSTFDVSETFKELKSPEKLQAAVTQFEANALQNGKPITILLVPNDYLRKLITSGKGEAFNASLHNAPADLRVIEVDVKEGSLAAAFTTPLMELKSRSNDIKETF